MIRYRLKKDLPDAKAGTILTKEDKPDGLYMYCGVLDGTDADSWYIKEVVENNPDWFELIKEEPKEWEIISYNHWKTGGVSLIPSMRKDDPTIIHSVKRIRDGEVFTVGDEIVNEFCELIKIDRFEYANGMTFPAACSGINGYTIDKIKKHTPKTKEVFTWDDALACEWAGYLEEVLKIETSTSQIPAILRMWKERHKSKNEMMNNHTEDTGGIVAEIKIEAHNNAIQSCIDVVRNDTFVQVSGIADRLIEKLQSLKK